MMTCHPPDGRRRQETAPAAPHQDGREDANQALVFLINHHGLDFPTINAFYKYRWKLELFANADKQNLGITTFVGASANAVKIQIWVRTVGIRKPQAGKDLKSTCTLERKIFTCSMPDYRSVISMIPAGSRATAARALRSRPRRPPPLA